MLLAQPLTWLTDCSTATRSVVSPTATPLSILGNERAQVVYTQHNGIIYNAARSPDSTRIVSASQDGTAWVWDAATSKHLMTYAGQTFAVTWAAWSPDGTRIGSASATAALGNSETVARVWDATTGKTLLTHSGHRHYLNAVT